MVWAKNGTPDTLSSSGDTLSISNLTACKFNQFLIHALTSGAAKRFLTTTDNNGNTDYAWRRSANGGTDTTATSSTNIDFNDGMESNRDVFDVIYGINIDSEEKLFISFCMETAAGASNAPVRNELVGKVDTTTNTGQYTRIDVNNDLAGDFAISSNLSAIGSELTPAAGKTIETGSIYIDTDTNQRYFWNGSSWSLQA